MAVLEPFHPAYTQGQTIAVTGTSSSISIDVAARQVMLTNKGTKICYVRVCNTPADATIADFPVLAGTQSVISKGEGFYIVSAIAPDGDTSLHVMPGAGW